MAQRFACSPKHLGQVTCTQRSSRGHGLSAVGCQRRCLQASLAHKDQEAAVIRTYMEHAHPDRPGCLAKVVEVAPHCRGLVAAQELHLGQPALVLPVYHSLSVPTAGKVIQWEGSWLQPFEQTHGALPPVLVEFLMSDEPIDCTYRLTILLLYVRQLAAAATAARRRSFWTDWLRLLPGLDSMTAPFGMWTEQDSQLLHYAPYRAAVAGSNRDAQQVCHELLDLMHTQRAGIPLASSVQDVMEALCLVKARSVTTTDGLSVLPLHDFINHSDTPSCVLTQVGGWHVVLAASDLAPGTELTLRYTPERTSNLNLLLAWGFVGRPSPLDPVLPLAYRALPGLDEHLVATAAAQLLAECGVRDQQQQDLHAQLLAAAASLPLKGPRVAADNQHSAVAGADAVLLHLPDSHYVAATAVLSKHGRVGFSPWLCDPVSTSAEKSARMPDTPAGHAAGPAAAAAVDVTEMYADDHQQATRVHRLQLAITAAQQGCPTSSNRCKVMSVGTQLQLASAQACLAAVQLQQLHAQLLAHGPTAELGWAAGAASPEQMPPMLRGMCHWQAAQELQSTTAVQLVTLQANLLLQDAASGGGGGRSAAHVAAPASAAAGAVLRGMQVSGAQSIFKASPKQQGVEHVLGLQRQQLKHLEACSQLLSDGGDGVGRVGLLASVAAAANSNCAGSLSTCLKLLRSIATCLVNSSDLSQI